MNDRRPSGDRNSYICIIPQRKRSCQLYKTPYFFSFFITKRRTKQYPTRLPSENKSVRKSRSRCRSPSPAGPTSIHPRQDGPCLAGARTFGIRCAGGRCSEKNRFDLMYRPSPSDLLRLGLPLCPFRRVSSGILGLQKLQPDNNRLISLPGSDIL